MSSRRSTPLHCRLPRCYGAIALPTVHSCCAHGVAWYLTKVATHPDWRNLRIATRLLEMAIQYMEKNQVRFVCFWPPIGDLLLPVGHTLG